MFHSSGISVEQQCYISGASEFTRARFAVNTFLVFAFAFAAPETVVIFPGMHFTYLFPFFVENVSKYLAIAAFFFLSEKSREESSVAKLTFPSKGTNGTLSWQVLNRPKCLIITPGVLHQLQYPNWDHSSWVWLKDYRFT